MNFIKKNIFFLFFLLVIAVFFSPFLLNNLLPIPSDTIVGMYHPFRDYFFQDYPNGIPFKNFLITDPVRQIIPWKGLSIGLISNLELPLWNPYEMAGKPLLANFQSGVFYPINLILFLKPFYFSWSIFILLQQILAGLFLYLYLKNFNLDKRAVFLGTIAFCFSGFFISWLEWGNILHTALWLPLILLSIDKIIFSKKFPKSWAAAFILSFSFSFFAGHLQTFFYIFIFSLLYLCARLFNFEEKYRKLLIFIPSLFIIFVIILIQLIPTLQFISLSTRNIDQANWVKEGWFVPWQNLIQFIAPDFFGNPATLNYWGVWNYGELVGFIGIIPLFFAIYSLMLRRDKKTFFFGLSSFIFLMFALPTPIAKISYVLNIPFLSTAQPTRLLFLVTFCFSVLSAFGFDYFIKNKKALGGILLITSVISLVFIGLWIFALTNNSLVSAQSIIIAKRNLIFPTAIFVVLSILILTVSIYKKKKLTEVVLFVLIIISSFELIRFGNKFEPFTKKEYLFPRTKTIEFLKNQTGQFRVVSTDSRILPPNFLTIYKIQSIEGYDPLYLLSYARFISAFENKDTASIISFNRIITPHNVYANMIDLLNVKYVLSFDELKPPKFTKVFEEGQTKVYKNNNAFKRAFFVDELIVKKSDDDQLRSMLISDLSKVGVVGEDYKANNKLSVGEAKIVFYKENNILIETNNNGDGFLILSDNYYPTWKAKIDGKKADIYKVDYTLRGIFVPAGNHKILFYNSIL